MIGRKEEKKFLKSLIYEEEPQFVAVFGRRRIGKTFSVYDLMSQSHKHRYKQKR